MADTAALRNTVVDIEDGATQIRSAATELTKRIRLYEHWLAHLPGRVEASCELWTTENGEESLHLALRRQGKEWALVVFTRYEEQNAYSAETLLRDAPLSTKIDAMRGFPKLLDAVLLNQGNLIKNASQAAAEFDDFARLLAIKEEK